MHSGPDTPVLSDTTAFTGHVWVQEVPTAGQFRFQVAPSGYITFATPDATYHAVETVPSGYRRAAATINTRLDRQAFQDATDTPDQVTFVGLAPRYEGIDYDWDTVPAFLGTDIQTDTDGILAPDTATTVYTRLNIPTPPAIEKETPADYADPDQYTTGDGFPASEWRDGSAFEVLIRDKAGNRARAQHPAVHDTASDPDSQTGTPAELAAEYATKNRITRISETLSTGQESPTVDAIRDHLIATIARREYAHLHRDNDLVVPRREFEAAIAERIQRHQHQ